MSNKGNKIDAAMNSNRYFLIFIFGLISFLLSPDLTAQRRGVYGGYSRGGRGFDFASMLHSINFSAGYYKPGMNYWNEESYLVDLGKSFDGGLMLQGGVDLKIYDGIILGFYAGTFSEKVEALNNIGRIERNEILKYKIVPISGVLKYEFNLGEPRRRYRSGGIANLHPFLGAGVNYTLITQTLKRDFTETEREDQKDSQTGSTITYSAIAGAKYDFTPYVGLGTELNYFIGSLEQDVSNNGTITTEKVSLTGPSIMATLYIKFGTNPGYGGRRARSRYRRR